MTTSPNKLHLLFGSVIALLLLIFTGCSGSKDVPVTDTTVDTSTGSAATSDDETSTGEGDLGTIVGNPNNPKISSLTIKTLSADTASSDGTAQTDSERCKVVPSADVGAPHTQECLGTPREFHVGLTAVYLVSCLDALGVEVTCGSASVTTIEARVPVLSENTNLTINDSGTTMNLDLTALTETKNFGGLQFITNYIGQKFPSDGDADADMIVEHLRGRFYRICTAPNDTLNPEEMTSACGYGDAKRGDMLFDANSDGVYGFVDTAALTADAFIETQTRPTDYDEFIAPAIASGLRGFTNHPENEYTDGTSFGTAAGYFAPLFSFSAVSAVSPESAYDFSVAIDIHDTFQFKDGARHEHDYTNICVAALVPDGCPDGDDDPTSVGVYNPYYDGVFVIKPPVTSVTVSQ